MRYNKKRLKVGLELTSKCNLRCGMCPLPVLRRPYEDMDWPLVEKAEREIHGLGLQLKWLHEMGEPLLYPRIGDAVRLFPWFLGGELARIRGFFAAKREGFPAWLDPILRKGAA